MVSLDVISLFTNVSTDETLTVVRDKLAADPSLEEHTCILIDNLKMLIICMSYSDWSRRLNILILNLLNSAKKLMLCRFLHMRRGRVNIFGSTWIRIDKKAEIWSALWMKMMVTMKVDLFLFSRYPLRSLLSFNFSRFYNPFSSFGRFWPFWFVVPFHFLCILKFPALPHHYTLRWSRVCFQLLFSCCHLWAIDAVINFSNLLYRMVNSTDQVILCFFIDWLIFNGMSTHLGFLCPRLGIVFIVRSYLHFLCRCFLRSLVWVLWHINLCGLSNAKSIFMQKSVLFQTIQFSMSTQFNCSNISILSYLALSNSSNSNNSV